MEGFPREVNCRVEKGERKPEWRKRKLKKLLFLLRGLRRESFVLQISKQL